MKGLQVRKLRGALFPTFIVAIVVVLLSVVNILTLYRKVQQPPGGGDSVSGEGALLHLEKDTLEPFRDKASSWH